MSSIYKGLNEAFDFKAMQDEGKRKVAAINANPEAYSKKYGIPLDQKNFVGSILVAMDREEQRARQQKRDIDSKASQEAYRTKQLAQDKENISQLKAELAQLEKQFDPSYEYSDDYTFWNKQKGIASQISALKKRISDVDGQQVNELSPQTLASYKKKAGADASAADKKGDYKRGDKRMSGIIKATKKEFDNDSKNVSEDELDENCWKGYHKEGNKELFGKTVPNCVKNEGVAEEQHSCPHCGGEMVSEELMNEKKDACYYKVKSRYKVWPSAYASGALVKCRKKGADSWGNGGKKNESSILEGIEQVDENLHKWFKEKWVRFGPDGKIRGVCARGDDSEGKPKCLPQSKAQNLGKKGRASAAARKRREDPNPERSGKAINVNTKKKSNEGVAEAGDTAKGQKMLAKVHNRAADRVTSKQADKDPAYARKAQQTQDRAWERLAVKEETLDEKWSQKYKDSINCSNPKGFSQKAHCQGKNK